VPPTVGDYYSWGTRGKRDLILTITSHYFYLDGDSVASPIYLVGPCEGIGVGERPLLSHDGKRISTFVRGTIVIRDLADCQNILDTGFQGAKADFSWDGRYVAFHAPKEVGPGYDIYVIDLKKRTVRTITQLPGSSFFPSWTRDGRLCFRYDGDDYRGFMLASDVLSAPARPLPTVAQYVPRNRTWSDIFPETVWPPHTLNIVMVWGTYSAHSPFGLTQLAAARAEFEKEQIDVGIMIATEPASRPADVKDLLEQVENTLPTIPLSVERLPMTEGQNQIPAVLLFRDGRLIDRRLGAQSTKNLAEWVVAAARMKP
jgi:hypothetical protein